MLADLQAIRELIPTADTVSSCNSFNGTQRLSHALSTA